jgi:hypothetical protein
MGINNPRSIGQNSDPSTQMYELRSNITDIWREISAMQLKLTEVMETASQAMDSITVIAGHIRAEE